MNKLTNIKQLQKGKTDSMNTLINFASKSNNSKKDKLGNPIPKTRIWLEESKGNRFLSDHGFARGTRFDWYENPISSFSGNGICGNTDEYGITHTCEIVIYANPDDKYKISGKDDRSIIDITRNRNNLPMCFRPENNNGLRAEFYGEGRIYIRPIPKT